MSLANYPVILPFSTDPSPQAAIHTLHLEAVASAPAAAIRVAKALCTPAARLHLGAAPVHLFPDRAQIGDRRSSVPGPYAYVFTRSLRIPHLTFAPHLDGIAATEFSDSINAIDPDNIYGLLLDGAALDYITSVGLSALAQHSKRLNIHCFRMPDKILKVMDVVGVTTVCSLHYDLKTAAAALVARAAR
jgi:anti-anti-sigma regulatory factor